MEMAVPCTAGAHNPCQGFDSFERCVPVGMGMVILVLPVNGLDLFACLTIRSFQLIFLAGTMFLSHDKSAGTVFRFVFSAKRTGPCGNSTAHQSPPRT